jgi:LemA protein
MRATWIAVVVAVVALIWAVVTYNRLVRARNLVREAFGGIDVQLRRRADLVPNLVEVVKGYAAHERGVLEDVEQKRASSLAASDVTSQAETALALKASLRRLMALAEAYPQLKADQSFRKLQDQLADIEDHLQMVRRYYNGAVRDLNIAIATFPDNLVSQTTGFREEPFFELDDRADAAVPKLAFMGGAT